METDEAAMAIENDIVLIYLEDSPIFFARVESIWPDVKRDWFNIELLVLQVPLKVIIWTLKDDYINGGTFYMDGKAMRMEVVKPPDDALGLGEHEEEDTSPGTKKKSSFRSGAFRSKTKRESSQIDSEDGTENQGGRIVSFADFQNRKKKD